MDAAWKPNAAETRRRLEAWWRGEGVVLGAWYGAPAARPHARTTPPPTPPDAAARYTDVDARVRRNHDRIARTDWCADTLPIAETDLGPGALALFLGAEPRFMPHTVWHEPVLRGAERPEALPPLRFDPSNRWWRLTERLLRASVRRARRRYMTALPDLTAGIDTLAALRGTEEALYDLYDRPGWVLEKLSEINDAWFEAYDRIYDVIRQADGSVCTDDFRVWGPGRTAMVQCDLAAMLSPALFERFVVPFLTAQAEHLDHALFHLDGPRSLVHLDAILGVDAIQAVEWTPGAGQPGGGDPVWYDLYHRILDAGKALQVVDLRPEEVRPLVEAVGPRGIYVVLNRLQDASEAERVRRTLDRG